jgi:2-methylcitrate dehydratase PrpD
MSNPLVYDADAVADPIVRGLARRIELVPREAESHETPGFWPAEIVIECEGQRHTLRTRPHKGSPRNPFTWEEAAEKFRRYTASVLDPAHAAAVVAAVDGLERTPDVSDLARVVAGA